jgi:hypothetical protein
MHIHQAEQPLIRVKTRVGFAEINKLQDVYRVDLYRVDRHAAHRSEYFAAYKDARTFLNLAAK